jgi:uncharacterized glyoxalase superfamily protein PhnB
MTFTELTPNCMVEDVAATVEWYERWLDAEEMGRLPDDAEDPEWAQVRLGDVSLMFQTRASLEEELPAFAEREVAGSTALYIDVEDAEALHDELAGAAEVVLDFRETAYGRREFAVTDPNGYVLWFGEKV